MNATKHKETLEDNLMLSAKELGCMKSLHLISYFHQLKYSEIPVLLILFCLLCPYPDHVIDSVYITVTSVHTDCPQSEAKLFPRTVDDDGLP